MAKDKQNTNDEQMYRYKSSYNEKSLFATLTRYAKKMGKDAAYNALTLYYTLISGESSMVEKSIIIGALGYLIMPFDLMPDFLPGGIVDDVGILTSAIQGLSAIISSEIKRKAKIKLKEFLK